jgi:alanyl-tRNA synthetase
VAFTLHDTHGFPVELTVEIAGERGVDVDRAGFEEAMGHQRERARQARQTGTGEDRTDAYRLVLEEHGTTVFLGYDRTESDVTVTAVLPVGDDQVEIFTDHTPFYAEAGGQVGDTGMITTPTGRARVVDTTYALPDLPRHIAEIVEGTIEAGQKARVVVDHIRRDAIRRHHTGTHLLHWALREVLGPHVKQAGSIVLPDRLRFDFSHHSALTPGEIAEIEARANQEVLSNAPVHTEVASKREADERGVIAFFGDKYGETVRILRAGESSMELCGGTHVKALGDIGPIKIISEGSIGANTRRIEAVTGQEALDHIAREEASLRELAAVLGVATDDVVPAVERRLDEMRILRDEVKALRAQLASGAADELAGEAVDGVVVARRDGLDQQALRDLAVKARDNRAIRAVVLGGVPDPDAAKVALVAAVSPDSGFVASDLLTEAARTVGGGGGKGGELANAGGREPAKLDEALDQVRAAAGIGG